MNRRSALVATLVVVLFLVSCASPSEPLEEPLVTDSASVATSVVSSPTSAPPTATGNGQAIIADHTAIDLSQIPAQWLEQAKQDVVWIYGSTSHGTQVWTGAEYLSRQVDPPTYCFAKEWWDPPTQGSPSCLRMGYDDSWSWDPGAFLDMAREMLDNAPLCGPGVANYPTRTRRCSATWR